MPGSGAWGLGSSPSGPSGPCSPSTGLEQGRVWSGKAAPPTSFPPFLCLPPQARSRGHASFAKRVSLLPRQVHSFSAANKSLHAPQLKKTSLSHFRRARGPGTLSSGCHRLHIVGWLHLLQRSAWGEPASLPPGRPGPRAALPGAAGHPQLHRLLTGPATWVSPTWPLSSSPQGGTLQ